MSYRFKNGGHGVVDFAFDDITHLRRVSRVPSICVWPGRGCAAAAGLHVHGYTAARLRPLGHCPRQATERLVEVCLQTIFQWDIWIHSWWTYSFGNGHLIETLLLVLVLTYLSSLAFHCVFSLLQNDVSLSVFLSIVLHFFFERHFWRCRQSKHRWFYQRCSFLPSTLVFVIHVFIVVIYVALIVTSLVFTYFFKPIFTFTLTMLRVFRILS